jgi:hypothetical protein
MQTPTNLSLWLNDQVWPIGILIALIVLTYFALKHSASRRRAELARAREGVTEETFADYMAQFGFDRTITASTYRYLQQVQLVDFPILPSDKLDEDLGLDLEDVQQTLDELAAALNRQRYPGLIQTPIVTVEDLVRILQASPRVSLESDYQQASVA